VQSSCLRTGERCMSYFNEPGSGEPFIFSNGQWTLDYNAPVSCGGPTGPRVRVNRNAQLDLPQPTADPIDVLVGQGTEKVSDDRCALAQSYDLRFERIGD
jgi:serine/threonine-protein kinase